MTLHARHKGLVVESRLPLFWDACSWSQQAPGKTPKPHGKVEGRCYGWNSTATRLTSCMTCQLNAKHRITLATTRRDNHLMNTRHKNCLAEPPQPSELGGKMAVVVSPHSACGCWISSVDRWLTARGKTKHKIRTEKQQQRN